MAKRRRKNILIRSIFSLIIWILVITCIVQLYLLHLIPLLFFIMIAGILVMLALLIATYRRTNLAMIVAGLMLVGLVVGNVLLFKTNQTFSEVVEGGVITVPHRINLYIEDYFWESDIYSINDLNNKKIGVITDNEKDYYEETIQYVKEHENVKVIPKWYDNINEMLRDLHHNEIEAIMINRDFVPSFDSSAGFNDESISLSTKLLYEHTIDSEEEVGVIEPNKNITKQPFALYLSGSDTREDILGMYDRSDVNVLALVHPTQKSVLMITTPRDYYIPLSISNGQLDKLTHAGSFGIQCSMDTLEMLYGIDEVRYFAKINFKGFEDIIDALDGVDVYSDLDFDAKSGDEFAVDFYHITKGTQHLSGEAALAFVRERQAFEDGDLQRGRNQLHLLEALLKKVSSPTILTNYNELIASIHGCFMTNMPRQDIESLVKMQLSDASSWSIHAISVSGETDYDYCWSAGEELSVVYPNEEELKEVKETVNAFMKGDWAKEHQSQEQLDQQNQIQQEKQEKMAILVKAEIGLTVTFILMLIITIVLMRLRIERKKRLKEQMRNM